MDGGGRVKPRPEMRQQDVAECKANPRRGEQLTAPR